MGTVMYHAYAALGTVLYALAWPVLAVLGSRAGAAGRGWRERMGFPSPGAGRGAVVIHAASVGEVAALGPMLREIARRRPGRKVALSVMTPAGKRRAIELYRCPVVHAPLDAPAPARRWVDRMAPRALIVMETELWPAWLSAAAGRVPVAWVNGRLSDRSYPRYRLVRPVLRRVFSAFRLLCVISRLDGERAVRLGARRGSVRIMGNLKIDLMAAARPARSIPGGPWIVAGSTRPGEEEIVLDAFGLVRPGHPGARLCLAPRHLRRAGRLARMAGDRGWRVLRRSEAGKDLSFRLRSADVLILDSHGELAGFYGIGAAAFVGGTLVPVGGHNVLEPAVAGVPVLFGPHTANVREYAGGLERCGGGFRVRSARTLAAALFRLLSSERVRRRAGRLARAYVRRRQGVSRRVVGELISGGIV